MYNAPAFREERPEVLHGLIQRHPLGLLITADADGPMASSIPFQLTSGDTQGVRLLAHIARANPQVKAMTERQTCLIVFQGPQTYVSPGFYPSKAQNPKVVPTWNYIQVQVRGRLRLVEDADWLRAQITALTQTHEADREMPWQVEDAPEDFIAAQMRAIIGLEITPDSFEGKWKVSQNRQPEDQWGVVAGLRDTHGDMAEHMSASLSAKGITP